MKTSRIAFSALTAGLLVLGSGAAAFAADPSADGYAAPGTTASVDDSTPAPGDTIVFTITTDANPVVLTVTVAGVPDSAISIAGTQSLQKANPTGTVSFDVTIAGSGTATLQATDTDGNVLATQVVTVAAATGGDLAHTGSNDAPLALGAAALVIVGAGGVVLARRRRVSQN